jgi:adenylate kinase
MLNIVLFGPPGAGKGTQSENLISRYNLVHLSTGDILRSEISAGTELGMKAKQLMDDGVLVPDDVVIGMISRKLDQNKDAKGFIFDGFPRTAAQAEALDMLLKEKNSEITMMLALEVSDEELTKRLLLRGQDSGRADDQNEEVIKNRINEYNTKTAPLKEYYSAQNKFFSVYGIGSVEEISENLYKAIEAKQEASSIAAAPEREEEGLLSKIVSAVKNVFSSDEPAESSEKQPAKKTPAKKASAQKNTKKDRPAVRTNSAKAAPKSAAKKAPAKKASKAGAKKAAKKTVNKAAKKVDRKAIKKVAKKVTKVSAKKAVKKAAKKVNARPAKKVVKAVKKLVKKVVKKLAPKKTVKKAASRKPVKKASVKKVVKKIAAKKTVKKAAKKVAKKVNKLASGSAKKAAPKKSAAKKSAAKKSSAKKSQAKKTGKRK